MANTRKTFRRSTLALATLLALGTGSVFAATAQFAHVGTAANLHPDDFIVGNAAGNQSVHIEVALKMRNPDVLNNFVAALHAQPGKVAPMDSDHFLANHAPTVARAQAVVDFLTQAGFHNVVVAPNRLLVSADGTAEIAANAFQTTLAQRAHGRRPRSRSRTPTTRTSRRILQGIVLAVLGLQTVHQAHTFARVQDPKAVSIAVTGHYPTEFSSIYGGSRRGRRRRRRRSASSRRASITQTITDLNTFTSQNGLATVTTQTVNTNGTSTDTSGVVEWNLDSQDIVGMGGGQVQKIIFYNIPTLSNANLTADFNTVVTANAAKIINVSLGECETSAHGDGSAASQDQIFAHGRRAGSDVLDLDR